ncbi:MAG: Bacterial Ig-like domain (group 2) [Firmicutes bacterium ADurb.Bin419]|nr:MAG: Bacterial Ig-like domain (group 2) [Firmicutes bacterium ADurb.Bin419]
MEVGKTQKIQVTVLPYNATEPKVEYISEDHKIATIDTSGEIKAVKEGTAVINIKAGEVTKQITIYVVTATEKIEINKSYIVLKTNEQFKLKCSVLPRNANQKIEYKSNDTSIAKVDGNGLITAVDTGVATIVVSNGYMQSEVTVLVNKDLIEEVEEGIPAVSINNDMDPLTEILKESHDMKVVVGKSKFDKVTKSALKYLYDSKMTLLVDCDDYLIIIDGSDIVNYENEISTSIECTDMEDGMEVVVNNRNKLPGKIGISFEEQNLQNDRYIYLYNASKGKYEILKNAIESGTIKVDIGGKYLLTDRELSFLKVNLSFIIIGSVGFLTVIFSYIFVKKKYWFW